VLTIQDHAFVFHWSVWINCTRTNGESAVLFGSADKVMEICSRNRPELWPNKWILHHDSVPAHDVLKVQKSLKMGHPPYSPDLVQWDVWLFPKLKKCPEGTKNCWHSCNPTQSDDITARYSGKDFQDFRAVAP
jgi:hypothetical protein